ncbi:MAG: HNH endonuclease [Pseudanabaena sp.]|uniref:HNH endonuclease n=1 Tax=Pseudanabaena mucicola TaxID=71190 RepID=UPI003306D068
MVPIFRQGTNDESNLALACRSCNLGKGTRISGNVSDANGEVLFFLLRQNH